jgi:predicted dehydrogenase
MRTLNRRAFLGQIGALSAGAIGFPTIISSSAWGAGSSPSPSNRIVMGCIGVGWQGGSNLNDFVHRDGVQMVAVCDVDHSALEQARRKVNEKYQNADCEAYHDFRDLIAREDIDAVIIATPDHWHGVIAAAAARAGKDIYGEKPLTHTFREGQIVCDTVRCYNRIWQTGSWQRSYNHFRYACELVRNGRIGKVHTVQIGLGSGHNDFAGTRGQTEFCPPPPELDYEFWLGPAPYSPYCPARVNMNWRWNCDTGGGQLMDWVGHHIDIAHWGLGLDHTGPVEIEAVGEFPSAAAVWNTPTRFLVTTKYDTGVTMTLTGGMGDYNIHGVKWFGTEGWVWVERQKLDANPRSLLEEKIGDNEIHLYRSTDHAGNFLNCVRSRQPTITPAETAHRSATPGHLGQIAMTLGRKIRFDPSSQRIIGDPTAESMLGISLRSPWHL